MSTATIEQTETPKPYVAPSCRRGMAVQWYRNAAKLDEPALGYIDAVYPQSVDVSVMIRGVPHFFMGCRHVSDPVYKRNSEWGDNGCWDYTAEYLSEQAERQRVFDAIEECKTYCHKLVDDLRVRVSDIEVNAQLEAATKPKK